MLESVKTGINKIYYILLTEYGEFLPRQLNRILVI